MSCTMLWTAGLLTEAVNRPGKSHLHCLPTFPWQGLWVCPSACLMNKALLNTAFCFHSNHRRWSFQQKTNDFQNLQWCQPDRAFLCSSGPTAESCSCGPDSIQVWGAAALPQDQSLSLCPLLRCGSEANRSACGGLLLVSVLVTSSHSSEWNQPESLAC